MAIKSYSNFSRLQHKLQALAIVTGLNPAISSNSLINFGQVNVIQGQHVTKTSLYGSNQV